MTSGMVMTTPAAIWEPKGVLNCEAPVNLDRSTVAGCIAGSLIIVTATRNSFHAPMKMLISRTVPMQALVTISDTRPKENG